MNKLNSLLSQLRERTAVSYLQLEPWQVEMWDFLTTRPPLFNTRLLFRAAARPHFDYLFSEIDFLGMQDPAVVETVVDAAFQKQLLSLAENFLQPVQALQALEEIIRLDKLRCTLITTKVLRARVRITAAAVVTVDDIDPFGNVEPVWRSIQAQLPAHTDVFLLGLDIEKFLIGPRLKMKFKKPVVDVLTAPTAPKLSSYQKLKRVVRGIIYQ